MKSVRMARVGEHEAARRDAWEKALRGLEEGSCEVLKREGSSRVLRTSMLGLQVVIKVRQQSGLADRLKWWTGTSRGHRHWSGAEWLLGHGFKTARPLVLASRGNEELLVMEALEGKSLLQHMADRDLPVRDQHQLAREVGRQVSEMRKAGRFNRDHKPSNLMVSRHAEAKAGTLANKRYQHEGFSIAVIDCVAIRPGEDGAVRMLHSLAVEPTGLKILPRRTILARVIRAMVDADFAGQDDSLKDVRLAKWACRRAFRDAVIESLRRHGDPTPKTNPLAAPEGASR